MASIQPHYVKNKPNLVKILAKFAKNFKIVQKTLEIFLTEMTLKHYTPGYEKILKF